MSDDPTNKLPGDASRYDTQPTLTTVLERMNELGNSLRAEIRALRVGQEQLVVGQEQLRAGQEQLRVELKTEVQSLRSEMNEQFAKVATQFKVLEKKMGILTREVMDVRAEQELYDDRLEKLEEKTR